MTILGITAASGGLGASTLTCALGLAAVRAEWAAAVVDGEVFTGGLQVTAGVEHEPGHRWREFVEVDGPVDGQRLLSHLPRAQEVAVLSAGRHTAAPEGLVEEAVSPPAFASVVRALASACDFVVVDWGRSAGQPGLADATVLLSGLSPRGLADALSILSREGRERFAGIITRAPKQDARLSAALAEHVGLPLLGQLRDDRSVGAAAAQGVLPGQRRRGPLARLADSLVAAIAAAQEEPVRAARVPAFAR
ncbi:MAG: hypothetical protein V9G19_00805 [Tetrasphaera sp.]